MLYAKQIPRSELGEREAVAGTGAPIVVAEWSKASTHSPLAIATDAAALIDGR